MSLMLLGLPPEVGVVLVLVLFMLVFGGSRLAGLGKNAGTAIREFKEETQTLRQQDEQAQLPSQQVPVAPVQQQVPAQAAPVQYQQVPVQQAPEQPQVQPVITEN
ncbi:MAG: twin-arginine translocase TatA/TatE family subunit [Propionibacteriaceae bacterium]